MQRAGAQWSFRCYSRGPVSQCGPETDWFDNSLGMERVSQCNVPAMNNDFIAIAAGSDHGLGLRDNGSIVTWGCAAPFSYGQCNVPSPNGGFIAIAAGGYHSLGLKNDGTILAWGYNGDGECSVPGPNNGFVAVA